MSQERSEIAADSSEVTITGQGDPHVAEASHASAGSWSIAWLSAFAYSTGGLFKLSGPVGESMADDLD